LSSTRVNLPAALASIVALRTAINAAFRSPLPFLGAIAIAFDADPASIGWLGAAFSIAALTAPFTGLIEARLGRSGVIIVAIGLFAFACFALPFAPTLTIAAVLFVLLGVAKALFEPQSIAFISEHVPFERRGAAVGIVELAWALAWILGTPMFGFFVDYGRWWMTFVVCGIGALIAAAFVLRYSGMGAREDARRPAQTGLSGLGVVLRNGPALRMLAFGALISMPAQIVSIVYGPWMREAFALSATVLGVVSIVVGLADLLAELATIVVVDRLGKRASLLISTALYVASFAVFWLGSGNLAATLVGLFLIFFTFEFALVTSLAVQSELVPDQRATMAGSLSAAHNLARMLASLWALPLFIGGGLGAVVVACAALVAGSLLFVRTLGGDRRAVQAA
jgi:predicted MFS family arabinose efflux permease